MKKRFKDDYSASAEVRALLEEGGSLHDYIRAHPEMKGASEWGRVAGYLNRLGAAYGVSFPMSEDAAVRRVGDAAPMNASHKARRADGQSLGSVPPTVSSLRSSSGIAGFTR